MFRTFPRIWKPSAARLARTALMMAPAVFVSACGDIPEHRGEFEPSGIVKGTVFYTGPLPCTENGHVLGGVPVLIFTTDLLPPPEGLGTTARSLAAVTGDVLFSSVQKALPSNPDGSIACPPDDAPHVSVSAEWSVGPLPAGRYQARAFFDRDGDFSPILKIHNLPTAGDVGGGALSNTTDAAQGAKPKYQTIVLGNERPDGSLVMPETGTVVEGVAVSVGVVLTTARPIAHVDSVVDERPGITDLQTNKDDIRMPVDQRFSLSPTVTANAAVADKQFIRMILRAGVPESEWEIARKPPISLQAIPPYNKFRLYPNRDDAGKILPIPEKTNPVIPDLFPQAILARLHPSDPQNQTPYADPAVIIQSLVSEKGVLSAVTVTKPADIEKLTVSLRPSAICTRPTDPQGKIYLVTPSLRTLDGQQEVISDVADLKQKIAMRFHRPIDDVKVVEGCLPPGKYSINLVYDTSQAWTIPNEAGACIPPLESPSAGGCFQDRVGTRPLLPSQSAIVKVGGEQTPGYCDTVGSINVGDPLPAGESFIAGVPSVCLPLEERTEAAVRARVANP